MSSSEKEVEELQRENAGKKLLLKNKDWLLYVKKQMVNLKVSKEK